MSALLCIALTVAGCVIWAMLGYAFAEIVNRRTHRAQDALAAQKAEREQAASNGEVAPWEWPR